MNALRPRRPWIAMVLSLLAPGLGHLYAGSIRAAVRWYFVAWANGVTTFALFFWFPLGRPSLLIGLALAISVYLYTARDASQLAASNEAPRQSWERPLVYTVLFLALAVVGNGIADVVRGRVFEGFHIPSKSMVPALEPGDMLWVKKFGVRFPRGSLAVFDAVDAPGISQVKRVVGLPGDTLRMSHDSLYRNSGFIAEPYASTPTTMEPPDPKMRWQVGYLVSGDPRMYRPTLRDWGPIVVPRDSMFVLGDNRGESYDSRYYGFVGFDRIRGRPYRIYYSYDPQSVLPLPTLAARWDRIGRLIEGQNP